MPKKEFHFSVLKMYITMDLYTMTLNTYLRKFTKT